MYYYYLLFIIIYYYVCLLFIYVLFFIIYTFIYNKIDIYRNMGTGLFMAYEELYSNGFMYGYVFNSCKA